MSVPVNPLGLVVARKREATAPTPAVCVGSAVRAGDTARSILLSRRGLSTALMPRREGPGLALLSAPESSSQPGVDHPDADPEPVPEPEPARTIPIGDALRTSCVQSTDDACECVPEPEPSAE